jgi:enoyl-[acyl-carrier protein] reductase / trans-2-enoyl-CoA reductase (NAD+)
VIQPLGSGHSTKTLDFSGDAPALKQIGIEPATEEEAADTVKVMGGEDWALWVDALNGPGLPWPTGP